MTTATGQHGGLLARVIDARERSGEFAARHAPRGERSRRPDRAAVERQRVTRARRALERVRANAPFSTVARPVGARAGRAGEDVRTAAGLARLDPPPLG